jgi:hypothetical protein
MSASQDFGMSTSNDGSLGMPMDASCNSFDEQDPSEDLSLGDDSAHSAGLLAKPCEGETEMRALAKRESRSIIWWRVIVMASILIFGALVSTGAYFFLSVQEENAYRNEVRKHCVL